VDLDWFVTSTQPFGGHILIDERTSFKHCLNGRRAPRG
jgi:hypothetical protein